MKDNKTKQTHSRRRTKTQSSLSRPYDESIIEVCLKKLERILQTSISESICSLDERCFKLVEQDIQSISQKHRLKPQIDELFLELKVLYRVSKNQSQQSLTQLQHPGQPVEPLCRVSKCLLSAYILKSLNKEKEGDQLISDLLKDVSEDSKTHNKSSSVNSAKLIELYLQLILFLVQQYSKTGSNQFSAGLYEKAYEVSRKNLTQYHQLTQTIFKIWKNSLKSTKRQSLENGFKGSQAEDKARLNSKRPRLNKFKKERDSVNSNSMSKAQRQESKCAYLQKQTKQKKPRRLQPFQYNNSGEAKFISFKEVQFNKIYGIYSIKTLREKKKLTLRPKYSTSMKAHQESLVEAVEMKELEQISKIYLPQIGKRCRTEIQSVPKSKLKKKSEDLVNKKKSIQIIMKGSDINLLKPEYFKEKSCKEVLRLEQGGNRTQKGNFEKNSVIDDRYQSVNENRLGERNQGREHLNSVHPNNTGGMKEKPIAAKKEQSCQLI